MEINSVEIKFFIDCILILSFNINITVFGRYSDPSDLADLADFGWIVFLKGHYTFTLACFLTDHDGILKNDGITLFKG